MRIHSVRASCPHTWCIRLSMSRGAAPRISSSVGPAVALLELRTRVGLLVSLLRDFCGLAFSIQLVRPIEVRRRERTARRLQPRELSATAQHFPLLFTRPSPTLTVPEGWLSGVPTAVRHPAAINVPWCAATPGIHQADGLARTTTSLRPLVRAMRPCFGSLSHDAN